MNKRIINNTNWFTVRKIFGALEFAAYYHRKQKRKGAKQAPYINHPITVANQLVTYKKDCDETLLVAAILHDTLEDTEATEEDISLHFGNEVLELVLEVTDNMMLSSTQRKKHQVEKASKLTTPAKAIKIADKTCNIRDILTTQLSWSRQRKIEYVAWAKQVIDHFNNTHPELIKQFYHAVEEASKQLKHQF